MDDLFDAKFMPEYSRIYTGVLTYTIHSDSTTINRLKLEPRRELQMIFGCLRGFPMLRFDPNHPH